VWYCSLLGAARSGAGPSRQPVAGAVRSAQQTDRSYAEALLEALRSGRIAPVTVKTVVQQELLALHRMGGIPPGLLELESNRPD